MLLIIETFISVLKRDGVFKDTVIDNGIDVVRDEKKEG